MLAHAWTARLVVILGTVLTFALLAMEYFKAYPYYSPRHLLAIAAGAAIMLAGSGWEVVSGRRSAAEALKFWAVAGYVALLVLALRTYSVESRAFCEFVTLLALFGFIINHHLPAEMRRPFFLVVCFVGIAGVLGSASVPAAIGLILAALLLIGIAHLPIPMWGRIAILLVCGICLATVRLGTAYASWAAAIVPILASMFMFRLAIYLYDVANGKGPKDIWGRLSYFFMFPNLVFPFFPVVDYAAFGRSYYNDDAIRIYQRGADFLLRGLIHLLLYRVVYTYFVLAPDSVQGPGTFLQFIVSNFALYLRISGMFHIITGLLVLFGFNLHETHGRYFFANGFIDIWRRMNIYWKDFMQKMIFNPSYLRIKRLGASHITSVVLATGIVFISSWALHAYQWFWLSGTVLFTLPDMMFWAVIGTFLMLQTIYEGWARPPSSAVAIAIASSRAFIAVRILCTFLTHRPAVVVLDQFVSFRLGGPPGARRIDARVRRAGRRDCRPMADDGGGSRVFGSDGGDRRRRTIRRRAFGSGVASSDRKAPPRHRCPRFCRPRPRRRTRGRHPCVAGPGHRLVAGWWRAVGGQRPARAQPQRRGRSDGGARLLRRSRHPKTQSRARGSFHGPYPGSGG